MTFNGVIDRIVNVLDSRAVFEAAQVSSQSFLDGDESGRNVKRIGILVNADSGVALSITADSCVNVGGA